MKSLRQVGAVVAGLLVLSNANANVFCQSTIGKVGVDPGGAVAVYAPALASDSVYLCQIGGTSNGISSEACKAILATLIAAKASGTSVQWAFTDNIPCGTRTAWTYLQNWYWGPILTP